MSEIDFLVNVRRILLSAIALMDKRIEFLKCIPVTTYEKETIAQE
jgi:hypothetical protein